MPKKKDNEKINNNMINPYELESMKKFMPNVRNPSIKLHQMSPIFRMLICGATGAGKTAYLLNLLSRFQKHFNKIIIYTAEEEPIYDWLLSQIPNDLISIYYNDFSTLQGNLKEFFYGSTLVVFDDCITVKDKNKMKAINDLFIRGRKLHNGVSICYLTQSYFDVPSILRKQINYLTIIKILNVDDLKRILRECKLNCTVEQLVKMYEYCCLNNFGDVLMIDKQSFQSSGKTYRKNFLEFLNPKDF